MESKTLGRIPIVATIGKILCIIGEVFCEVGFGLVLMVISLLCRYGAELEERSRPEEQP